jgi:RNA polymerase sigma factor (sigma-70 family)
MVSDNRMYNSQDCNVWSELFVVPLSCNNKVYEMQTTDKELLIGIASRNKAAFDLFYERYRRLFYDLAYFRTNDREICNDIMQNFWIIIWQKPETIKTDEQCSAKKYLYIYFTSRMSDYLYAANTRLMSNEEEGALENAAMQLPYTHVMEELAAHEIMGLVERTIDSMPQLTQQIFIHRWKNGYSAKETAEQLRISESAANERYNQAMSMVRKKVVSMYLPNTYTLLMGLYLLDKIK